MNLVSPFEENYDWGLKASLVLSSYINFNLFYLPINSNRSSFFNYNFLMKFKIFKFKSVTSTNDVALNLIQKEKKEIGCLCRHTNKRERNTWEKMDFR